MELSKLTANYDELTDLEKKIVKYIMDNPENILNLTANGIAEELYLSKTTIINLSKKLGFDGYSELRYYIKNYVEKKKAKNVNLTYEDILDTIYEEITKTLSLQSEENVKAIVERLLNAKAIYIIARGASKPIGDLLSSRLALMKVKSIFINDQNLIDVLGDGLDKEEVLLLMSLSGETEKIKNIAKVARARNVDVVSLTSFSNNTLQRIANYKLFCFAEQSETKYNDIISRLGLHTLVQMLITYMDLSIKLVENLQ
ncbi:MurR/RpiR family transcriptional regulator [Desnuesiella massiliensis]|uniref:MurR/RpiR family transcriptional regulator n=1 Tax=Desnuesiella massiliensis TaxID=1650662 RepID=UPI0006E40144|nr:MurR/RpiR family transcriptional regulator [Desnuesiella massiliensis]